VDMFWVIMQRLHMEDLTGYIITNQGQEYKHICLPAAESDDVSPPELRKDYVNGFLFPARFSPEELDKIKSEDAYMHAGQYQQRPSPEEGGDFKRQYWKYWKLPGMELPAVQERVGDEVMTCEVVDLPPDFDEEVLSWDMAFKDKKTSDYVVGQAWGSKGPGRYLMDQTRGKLNYAKSLAAVVRLKRAHPRASASIIEDKANGTAIISELRTVEPGIIEVQANNTAHSRYMPFSRLAAAGNVYLPHPAIAPWVGGFVDELAAYPNGVNDDQLTAAAQATNHLTSLKRIWPHYRSQLKNYKIAWEKLSPHTTLICSQWVDTDMSTSVVLGLWNAHDMKLTLFDELVISTPMADIVRGALEAKITRTTGGIIRDLEKFEWIGNALMFARKGTAGVTQSAHPKDGMWEAYSRVGVNLLDNPVFDEYGAMLLTARLIALKSIRVDVRCAETSRQMVAWCVDGSKPSPGYNLCRAICNMISVLWESGKMAKQAPLLKPYTKAKEAWMKEVSRADHEGRLESLIKSGAPVESVIAGSGSWM
jgi:predicted phage terminase large subunit-like protein